MKVLKCIVMIWFVHILASAIAPAGAHGEPSLLLKSGGRVLMIRHALAPGTGDPPSFRLGDCSTQRNLNDEGRRQAQRIGQWLRTKNITRARVYSSQWCRCLETAEIIDLGTVETLPALNSFFERPEDRGPNLSALKRFLSVQPADGPLIIMVTHFVTIAGITGEGVASGEAVVLQLDGAGGFTTLGRLNFED